MAQLGSSEEGSKNIGEVSCDGIGWMDEERESIGEGRKLRNLKGNGI